MKNFGEYSQDVMELRYSHLLQGRKETWEQIARRVVQVICRDKTHLAKYGIRYRKDLADSIFEAIRDKKLIPGGRQLSQTGREYHQTDNCYMMRAKDNRESLGDLMGIGFKMFMSGGGVGVSWDECREFGATLKRSGGIASGPVPYIVAFNALGAAARQGGERRGAIYASLKWDHKDVGQFIELKKNTELAHTNMSVRFDQRWLDDITLEKELGYASLGKHVFNHTLHNACKYGDPGFQFDWDNQILRNACTEIISSDDYDSCCLGHVNIAKIKDCNELGIVSELATAYLLLATLYTDVPVPEVRVIKEQNRRLGVGLMGVGEWFIQRGLKYGELGGSKSMYDSFPSWMTVYKTHTDYAADCYSKEWGLNRPVAVRAIAPTGTTSIVAGTTPGIEPVFHTAYLRTYNTLKTQEYQNGFRTEKVIEPIVSKWIEEGLSVENIDTAWTLSQSTDGIRRRIAFQAFLQEYVDNGISSTVNLPRYREGIENEIGPILLEYLPRLRGITFYPDGRYENQPVKPIELKEVLGDNSSVMGEYESCKGGVCGV